MMERVFIETRPEDIGHNPFKLIGADWMLITAGTKESYNTMTGAWGGPRNHVGQAHRHVCHPAKPIHV